MVDLVKLAFNYGLPSAMLAFTAGVIFWYFVRPFGGENGVFARFFQSMGDSAAAQTKIMDKQAGLTADLGAGISRLGEQAEIHHEESKLSFRSVHALERDLLIIHSLIAKGLERDSNDEEARGYYRRADEIVQEYLRDS